MTNVFEMVLLVCGLGVGSTIASLEYSARIVGGVNAVISEYPYQLSLEINGKHSCGASIIGPHWALTAAHCVRGKVVTMTLRAGSDTQGASGSVHKVAQKVVHGKYNAETFDFDIALLKVGKKFQFGPGVAKVALPTVNDKVAAGTTTRISGWGTTAENAPSIPTQLQSVNIPILSETVCKESYGDGMVTDRMICAGHTEGGKDACQGDSGGPMVSEGKLVGIVSFGHGCARPKYPGLYTRISILRPWIKARCGI